MNFIKNGYASFKKQFLKLNNAHLKPVSVQANTRYIYNNRYIAFSLLLLAFMLLPEIATAQINIQVSTATSLSEKLKNFYNNQIVPAAEIIAKIIIIGSLLGAIGLALARNPNWKFAVFTCVLVSGLWYGGPQLIDEIRNSFSGTWLIP